MSDILNAAEVRSGTWGELWLDGEQVAECYGCQIKVNKTKDDVTRCRPPCPSPAPFASITQPAV